jgi:hypothetical protein
VSGPTGPRAGHLDRFLASWERHESCYLDRLEQVARPGACWRERFRAATVETLRLAEEERVAARVLVVEPFRFGEVGRRRQQSLSRRLAVSLDTARAELPPDAPASPLAGEWLMAVFFHRVHRRLSTGAGPDLRSQLPELLFLGVAAYFGPEVALAELNRPA